MKYIKFWHVEDVKQRNDHKRWIAMEGTTEKNWNEPLGSFTQKKKKKPSTEIEDILKCFKQFPSKQQKDTQFATSTTV